MNWREETKIPNIYLYSIDPKGQIKKRHGCMYKTVYKTEYYVETVSYHFYEIDKRGKETNRLLCGKKPEVVYNNCVWMEEENDELAADILTEYVLGEIEKLKTKIGRHEMVLGNIEEFRKGEN